MKKYSFNVNHPLLEIESSVNIAVSPSLDSLVRVEIEGDEDDNISVKQRGDTIEIKANTQGINSQTIISTNGVTQISGGSFSGVSMVNGEIYISGGSGSVTVNGKRIDLGSGEGKEHKPTLIKIYTPFADLELCLRGMAKFASSQMFDDVFVDLNGSTQAIFDANEIKADLSGSSQLQANIKGGELNVDTSGSSNASIVGDVESVKADSSGSSHVTTSGKCLGDYKADASGCSSIRHKGNILGRARKRQSGMANIDI